MLVDDNTPSKKQFNDKRRSGQTVSEVLHPMVQHRSRDTRTAAIAGLVASALCLLVPLVFGMLRPEYSHVRDYISELGETGAPYAGWVNLAGFLPIGLIVLVFVFTASRQMPINRKSALLFSSVGWTYLVASVFPCDPGCPERGSMSQMIHNLTAMVCYPATIAGLMLIAISFRGNDSWKKLSVYTMVCGLLVALGFGLMLVPDFASWRGLAQRVAEAATFAWIAVIGVALWRTS